VGSRHDMHPPLSSSRVGDETPLAAEQMAVSHGQHVLTTIAAATSRANTAVSKAAR